MRGCAGSVQQQTQPRKHVIDHADFSGPNRQHEVDHVYKIGKITVLKYLHQEGIDHTGHSVRSVYCLLRCAFEIRIRLEQE